MELNDCILNIPRNNVEDSGGPPLREIAISIITPTVLLEASAMGAMAA